MGQCLVVDEHVAVAEERPPLAESAGQVAAWIKGTDEGSYVVVSHVAFRQSVKGQEIQRLV
jgi:hypothetical protein